MEPLVERGGGALRLPAEMDRRRDRARTRSASRGRQVGRAGDEPFDDWHFNEDRSRVVERLLRQRMEEMPPEDFQDLLRPCFQEDELKLILVGAALGFLAGLGSCSSSLEVDDEELPWSGKLPPCEIFSPTSMPG